MFSMDETIPAVTFISRCLHKPGVNHLTQAKNLLQYLKGTQKYAFYYTGDIARLGLRNQKFRHFPTLICRVM